MYLLKWFEKINKISNLITEDEYKTKDGRILSFKFEENVENTERKGFVIHKLDAFFEPQSEAFSSGKHVGYIKVIYIPTENVDQYYPTTLHFIDLAKGWQLLDYKSFSEPGEYPGHEEFAKKAHNRARSNPYKRVKDFPEYSEYESITDKRWEELAKYYRDEIRKTFKEDFERYLNYYVDKPVVEYIKVKKQFRRNRVGFNLYKKMAKILGNKGMVLYASGTQSEYAEKAWKKLRDVLPVKTKKIKLPSGGSETRYFIDYR